MHRTLGELSKVLLNCKEAADFDPRAHISVLPHVYILDVENAGDAPPLLKVRLSGTALDQFFQRTTKGHYLHEYIHGPRGDDVLASFRSCAVARNALWLRQVVQIGEKPARFVEGIAIWLAPDRIYGGLVSGALAGPSENAFERRELQRADSGRSA
jgi:hypothetical protein